MNLTIRELAGLSMHIFVITSLFGAGLGLTVKEIIEPLKKIRLVLRTLIANFILIPIMAYALSVLFRFDPALQAGIIIISCCAGEPLLPKLVTIAKGHVAGAIGTMILLMVITIFYAPIVLPLAIPGISVSPLSIARPLFVLMLIPLGFGLMTRSIKSEFAQAIRPYIEKAATICLLLTAIFIFMVDHKIISSAYGTGVYAFTGLFSICALSIGFIFGGTNESERFVITMGSGARNIAAALLIAASNFSDQRVITVVLIGSLMQFFALFFFAWVHKSTVYRSGKTAAT